MFEFKLTDLSQRISETISTNKHELRFNDNISFKHVEYGK